MRCINHSHIIITAYLSYVTPVTPMLMPESQRAEGEGIATKTATRKCSGVAQLNTAFSFDEVWEDRDDMMLDCRVLTAHNAGEPPLYVDEEIFCIERGYSGR